MARYERRDARRRDRSTDRHPSRLRAVTHGANALANWVEAHPLTTKLVFAITLVAATWVGCRPVAAMRPLLEALR